MFTVNTWTPTPTPTPTSAPLDSTDLLDVMDALTSMDALLSAVVGALIAVLGGFAGALLQGRREHVKWRRDQRLRAYADFIAATDNYLGAAHRGDESELPTVARASLTASAHVRLFGPDKVYQAAESLQKATVASIRSLTLDAQTLDQREDERIAARETFVDLARAQTKI
ncbi:hypothetical protein [Agromyces sp. GXQ0307]|uniref:hypothetical protein n=1 Tax=Agromyces sp. GXQ0307 TaxID=3377835 RepID=UPI00383A70A7